MKNINTDMISEWFKEKVETEVYFTIKKYGKDALVFLPVDKGTEYGEKFYGIFDFDKKCFINQTMTIKENLEYFDITDNPFDLIAHYAIEILRNTMIASIRYRNKIYTDHIDGRMDKNESMMDHIRDMYQIIDYLNEDTVEFLRKTSYFGKDHRLFNLISKSLLQYQIDMDTVYSHIIPCRDIEYEKIRLGEDSDEYQRMLTLHSLVDNNYINEDVYEIFEDSINDCKQELITEEEYEYAERIIQEYDLTNDDLEYMKSYMEKKLED